MDALVTPPTPEPDHNASYPGYDPDANVEAVEFLWAFMFCCTIRVTYEVYVCCSGMFRDARKNYRRDKLKYTSVSVTDEGLSSMLLSQCAICLEDFKVGDNVNIFRCQHSFHKGCFAEWSRVKMNCPICRLSITGSPPSPIDLEQPE